MCEMQKKNNRKIYRIQNDKATKKNRKNQAHTNDLQGNVYPSVGLKAEYGYTSILSGSLADFFKKYLQSNGKIHTCQTTRLSCSRIRT